MSMAEVKTQARWVAAKLVDPSRSWFDIARTDDPSGRYLSDRNVGVQARGFAAMAGLTLPQRRGRRRWIDR
jgi:hypothetical protein